MPCNALGASKVPVRSQQQRGHDEAKGTLNARWNFFSVRPTREAIMKKSKVFPTTFVALAFLGSVAIAQQATNGIVTKVDEPNGTVRIQYGQPGTVGGPSSDISEDFKVKDGLLFNALQIGDRVQFSAEQVDGAKSITKLEKQ
jgi:Cu/Ag efflux protein CusF